MLRSRSAPSVQVAQHGATFHDHLGDPDFLSLLLNQSRGVGSQLPTRVRPLTVWLCHHGQVAWPLCALV